MVDPNVLYEVEGAIEYGIPAVGVKITEAAHLVDRWVQVAWHDGSRGHIVEGRMLYETADGFVWQEESKSEPVNRWRRLIFKKVPDDQVVKRWSSWFITPRPDWVIDNATAVECLTQSFQRGPY